MSFQVALSPLHSTFQSRGTAQSEEELVSMPKPNESVPDNSLVTGTATVHAAFSASQPEALSTPV